MHVALVTDFGQPPRYAATEPPVPTDGEVVVDVLAAGLHPRVRSGASGSHYTSDRALPLVPGVDGVGRTPDGQRVYFLTLDSQYGSMAEQTLVRPGRSLPVPDGADDVAIAAGVNPAMSSWVPLRHRVQLRAGQGVLVLGATGTAGRMAVQIARRLGAGRVVGLGRDPRRLATLTGLGADAALPLGAAPADLAAALIGIDVVVDYLWGPAAEAVIPALLAARPEPNHPLTWLHIGAMSGHDLTLPSAALRAHNLIIMGSGQGAIATSVMAAEIPAIMAELAAGTVTIDTRPLPLRDVESTWNGADTGARIVYLP